MEFVARGSLTLRGVTFYIEADNLAEAKQKAAAGKYESYEIYGASAADCTVDRRSVAENK